MTKTDFICLLPLIILAAAPMVMMLITAFKRNFVVISSFSVFAFLLALLSVFFIRPLVPYQLKTLFVFDSFGLVILGIVIACGLIVAVLSYDYIKQQIGEKEEYFIVLFIATLGAAIVTLSDHFISLFLGIETLSISLYILVAYKRQFDQSIEAGIKYLILASVSAAFLLFGMALIYAETGTLELAGPASVFNKTSEISPVLIAGFGFMIVGIGFKLALVPFHLWTPDVYQGSPAPVAGFIATSSKGAVLTFLIRFFNAYNGSQHYSLVVFIGTIAVLSMFIGNLLALKQQNVKRLLAYSSIANLGYLLVTLIIGGANGLHVAAFYLIAYFITTIGAFGIVSTLSVCGEDADQPQNYRGLFWKRPLVAIVFTIVMLSLAGMPLTAGFMAKFYLVFEGLRSDLWLLVILLLINSAISLYYYLRVVTTMFSEANDEYIPAPSLIGSFMLIFIATGIIWIGIQPSWFLSILGQIK